MISGSKTLALLFGLSLSCWANAQEPEARAAGSSSADAQALIASLARPAPSRTPFAEARFMKVLEQPLVVSGELAWLGGDRLERRVEKPARETATIADGEVTQQREGRKPRSFSLRRAPQLQVLLDSFVALLGGDAGRLNQAFDVRQESHAGGWTLTLVPRDARVAKAIASIQIDGRGGEPRCMRMQEADGDLAVDLLGDLAARMPAAPTRDALAALCKGG
ncbi:hypothetical protein FHW84_001161 [Dyella sp. SG562]|uniref:outer membrane lipoprotein carrier protein LolA n=1 Tax=Dyella TaxID=231454 RepID=UPI00183B721E|nr:MULTISPECIES: outer membrane lipoprotein carrier protein LolA [unclassified Dyella]NII72595.1 hypothetical protein [Dyella sp. SG562]NKJ21876.1 hypothetical protein [Dyella sp. SG609]